MVLGLFKHFVSHYRAPVCGTKHFINCLRQWSKLLVLSIRLRLHNTMETNKHLASCRCWLKMSIFVPKSNHYLCNHYEDKPLNLTESCSHINSEINRDHLKSKWCAKKLDHGLQTGRQFLYQLLGRQLCEKFDEMLYETHFTKANLQYSTHWHDMYM